MSLIAKTHLYEFLIQETQGEAIITVKSRIDPMQWFNYSWFLYKNTFTPFECYLTETLQTALHTAPFDILFINIERCCLETWCASRSAKHSLHLMLSRLEPFSEYLCV